MLPYHDKAAEHIRTNRAQRRRVGNSPIRKRQLEHKMKQTPRFHSKGTEISVMMHNQRIANGPTYWLYKGKVYE